MAFSAFHGKNEKTDSPYKKYTFRFSLKFYIPLVVVVISLLFGLKFLLNDRSESYISVSSDSAGRTCVSIDGRTVKKELEGSLSGEAKKSLDSDVCAFLLYVKNSGNPYYSLCMVRNGRFRTVSDNATSEFMLSADGDGLAFTDTDGKLCLYDADSGKIRTVSDSADRYTLSPDGKTVLYSKYDDAGLSYVLYLWSDEKTTETGAELVPCAVGNAGRSVYAFSSDLTVLYSVSPDGNSKEKICSDIAGTVFFSRDMSSAVFTAENNTYAFVQGQQRKMIFENGYAVPVFGRDTVMCRVCTSSDVYVCSEDSLADTVYSGVDNSNVFFVDGRGGKTALRSDSRQTVVSSDGKYAFILNENGTLFRYSADKKAVAVQIADGVNGFDISSDGKKTAYISTDGSLMFYDGRKTVRLDKGVNTLYFTDRNCVFYQKSENKNVLMCSEKGKTPTLISDAAYGVTVSDNRKAVFYYAPTEAGDGLFDRFASDGSAKFRKIMSDAELFIK